MGEGESMGGGVGQLQCAVQAGCRAHSPYALCFITTIDSLCFHPSTILLYEILRLLRQESKNRQTVGAWEERGSPHPWSDESISLAED